QPDRYCAAIRGPLKGAASPEFRHRLPTCSGLVVELVSPTTGGCLRRQPKEMDMPKTAAKKPAARSKAAGKQRPQRAARGKRAAMLEAAKGGKLPAPPNFKAETHRRWRPMLAEVVALAKA